MVNISRMIKIAKLFTEYKIKLFIIWNLTPYNVNKLLVDLLRFEAKISILSHTTIIFPIAATEH